MKHIAQAEDFELRHNLRDTIVLLGGEAQIADMLVKSQDGLIIKGDVEKLQKYNAHLFAEVKSRLRRLNRIKIKKQS